MKRICQSNLLFLCFVFIIALGVASLPGGVLAETKKTETSVTTIKSVQMDSTLAEPVLVIVASQAVTYTSYKSSSPARLVIDFSHALPDDGLSGPAINQGPVSAVTLKRFDTEAGVLTRMEIFLSQDLEPVIIPVADRVGELRVTFPGYTPVVKPREGDPKQTSEIKVAPAPKDQASTTPEGIAKTSVIEHLLVKDVKVTDKEVHIVCNTQVPDYKLFRLNKPERLVIDLPGAKTTMLEKLLQLNVAGISTVRIGAYVDKVRLVFDAINGSLNDPAVEKTADGLKLIFTEVASDSKAVAPVVQKVSEPSQAEMPQKVVDAPVVKSPVAVPVAPAPQVEKAVKQVRPVIASVESIDFQVIDGVSRIAIKGVGLSADDPVKSAKQISLKINKAVIAKKLQRVLETKEFVTPVLKITPIQIADKKQSAVLIKVALKQTASFALLKEAGVIYLDIKHPAEFLQKKTALDQLSSEAGGQKASEAVKQPPVDPVVTAFSGETSPAAKHHYSGRKVTLEFADAEVRKIFQLLSEVSNKNFVLGDEVTGNISLKLVNVPWDHALDVILDTKGLDKREEGSIVLIRGKGKFKSQMDEEIEIKKAQQKAEPLTTEVFDVNYSSLADIVTQFNAVKTDRGIITKDERTNKIIVKDIKSVLGDMRSLLKALDLPERQVIIEARIVEAQTSFTRSLGVNWGMHYRDGSAGVLGINSLDTTFGGITSSPTTSGVAATAGGAAGISFGTLASNVKLDLRMSAAVTAGMLKIVSTPRIATLNNKQAKISQGYEVPYQTIDDKGNPKIEFKKVDLLLEATPNINPNGTVNLKINAKNNNIVPGSTVATGVAITTKEASTEMLLKDGDTTVIGGIFVDTENDTEDGVPFLNELPFIGGLFKSSDKKKSRNELLIFITPRIMSI